MSSISIDSQHKRNVARVCPLVFLHIHYGTISGTCHSRSIVLSYISQFFGWRVNRVEHLASGGNGGIVVVVLPDDFRHRGHRDTDVVVLPFSRIASHFCQINDATLWRLLYTYRHASSHDVVTVSLRWTRASDFRK